MDNSVIVAKAACNGGGIVLYNDVNDNSDLLMTEVVELSPKTYMLHQWCNMFQYWH